MAGVTCAELTFIDGIVYGFFGLMLQVCLLYLTYRAGREVESDA